MLLQGGKAIRKTAGDRVPPFIAINKKLVELGKQQQWESLLEYAEQERRNFNNVNCATLLSQLSRIRSLDKNDPRFLGFLQGLAQKIQAQGLQWLDVRQVTNIVHAIGKMQIKNHSTKCILDWISEPETAFRFVNDKETTPQGISNVAWACSVLNYPAPALFDEVNRRSRWLVQEGKPQNIANVAWACGNLGHQAPTLFAEIDLQADILLKNWNAQDISNVSWACARLDVPATSLFQEIENHHANRLVKGGTAQAISNTAWAFARAGHPAPRLVAEIDQRAKSVLENSTNTQSISNLAWAFASLGHEAPTFFELLERQPQRFVNDAMQPQWISNIAWSFATLGLEAPQLFAQVEAQSKRMLTQGNAQAFSNTAYAFAKLNYHAPILFAEIDARAQWFVANATPQEVANAAWAFAWLGYDDGCTGLFAAIDQHLDQLLETFEDHHVCVMCHVIAILGLAKEFESSLKKLWNRATALFVSGEHGFLDENLRQLAQTRLFVEAEGITLPSLPAAMSSRMDQALEKQDSNQELRSTKEMSLLLHKIGFDHEVEVAVDGILSGKMLAIDFACLKRKIAIEYDGEQHYLRALGSGELTKIQTGRTKAKRRFLQQMGWTVINLDFRDFMKAQRESNEEEWLRLELRAAGIELADQN